MSMNVIGSLLLAVSALCGWTAYAIGTHWLQAVAAVAATLGSVLYGWRAFKETQPSRDHSEP